MYRRECTLIFKKVRTYVCTVQTVLLKTCSRRPDCHPSRLISIFTFSFSFSFIFVGLRISDDVLESELKRIKNVESVPSSSTSVANMATDTSYSSSLSSSSSSSSSSTSSMMFTHPQMNAQIHPKNPGVNAPLHPLKALLFLKLLCVHPCLVTSQVEHRPYYDHLLVRTYESYSDVIQKWIKSGRKESFCRKKNVLWCRNLSKALLSISFHLILFHQISFHAIPLHFIYFVLFITCYVQ